MSSRQKTKDPISAIRKHDNDISNDKKEMASILNDQFSSVFVTETQDEALPDFPFRTNNRLSDFKIETIDVEDLLAKLDKNKACGTDNVHSFVLKSCASSWAIPLAIIFRKSLDVGEVPKAWLEANMTPLCKKKAIVLVQ